MSERWHGVEGSKGLGADRGPHPPCDAPPVFRLPRPLGADSETDDYGFSHSSETDDASAAGSAVQRAAAAGGVPGGATGGARRNGVEARRSGARSCGGAARGSGLWVRV